MTTSPSSTSSKPFFLFTPSELSSHFSTSLTSGISTSEVEALQARHGPNSLSGGGGGVSVFGILAGQFFNAMTLVLIMAFAVSLGIKSWIEAGVIAAVILANVVVGFIQEYSSAKTMDSLRSLASPTATVIRSGKAFVIPSAQVVPGDLVEVKTGDVVPADLRLVDAMNFETDESLLTGESLPVAKDANASWVENEKSGDWDARDVGVGDRINMAFTSSTVTKGRATGIAVEIGMNTEIGSIAKQLGGSETRVREVKRDDTGHAPIYRYVSAWGLTFGDIVGDFLGLTTGTPLQRTLAKLAVVLLGIALLFAMIVFGSNGWRTEKEIVLYAVATGLSMIPASLVVVLTITLAGGTRAMASRHVIVRKLDSLEALGAVTDICSDKTGTLTQGKMVVRAAYLPAIGTITIGESTEPFNPTLGQLSHSSFSPCDSNRVEPEKSQAVTTTSSELLEKAEVFKKFLNVASMCNLAKVEKKEEGWVARGDPTECAIQVFAERFAWGRESLTAGEDKTWVQLAEFPFDSDTKRMSVIYRHLATSSQFVFTKGAVERLIPLCTNIQLADCVVPLTTELESQVHENVEALAEQGLRVLALASRTFKTEVDGELERGAVETELTLLGLVGIYDPPRPESQGAVRQCHQAGIQVHMLTGDHHATARAIALQVGILPRNTVTLSKEVIDSMVFTAAQFDKLSDEEIDALPCLPLVIARCAPTTKVRMVEALHRRKAFCAMTGDGVNDAPSLKRADIGIAMGMAGSDVAKDASDLILTDDNFASILSAIEEGRRMFTNIQKFILHLLAQNVIQALVLLIGLGFKDRLGYSVFPLAPVEILWVLMITSGFPAMGIGAEVAEPTILLRKPHNPKTGIFTPILLLDMFFYGITGATVCLATFSLVVNGFGTGELGVDSNNSVGDGSETVFKARSATFAVLTWISLFLALEVTDLQRSFFRRTSKPDYPWSQWYHDIYSNRFLFYSCVFGFFSVFPMIYIPVLNTTIMKHAPISWEWGIVFVACGVFGIAVEGWKWGKRVVSRRVARKAKGEEEEDLGIFGAWSLSKGETTLVV